MTAELSDCIKGYDEKIEKLASEKYGHTALLRHGRRPSLSPFVEESFSFRTISAPTLPRLQTAHEKIRRLGGFSRLRRKLDDLPKLQLRKPFAVLWKILWNVKLNYFCHNHSP